MTPVRSAVAAVLRRHPQLPPDTAAVFFLLCSAPEMSVPAAAKKFGIAQSVAARHFALLQQEQLVEIAEHANPKAPRYHLTDSGRSLAGNVAAEIKLTVI